MNEHTLSNIDKSLDYGNGVLERIAIALERLADLADAAAKPAVPKYEPNSDDTPLEPCD